MKKIVFLLLVVSSIQAFPQVTNTGLMDTTDLVRQGKVTVEGYIDIYHSYDFNKPQDGNRPYFVSMIRHHEVNINLAYIDVKYTAANLRARFVPGFGSYINANYAAEEGSLKNIVEASAGIRLFKKRNIWFDAGVFGSPYTNESAISKDHLAYTRSFAPEYVPYYLSGVRLTMPLSSKVNVYFYLLNGWQQIKDQNKGKSAGTQLEYRPTENLLMNWNTYVGKESSASDPTVGMRYFSDVYFIYNKGRWSATACFYAGQQQQENDNATWWQINAIGRYNLSEKLSVTARVEHFVDEKSVQIVPVTDATGFTSSGGSLGLNYKMAENILLRIEGRTFWSDEKVYARNDLAVNDAQVLTSNVTIWF